MTETLGLKSMSWLCHQKNFFGPTKEVGLNHRDGEPVSTQPQNCSQPSFKVKTVHTHWSQKMSLPQGSPRKHLPKGPEDFCRWATRGRHPDLRRWLGPACELNPLQYSRVPRPTVLELVLKMQMLRSSKMWEIWESVTKRSLEETGWLNAVWYPGKRIVAGTVGHNVNTEKTSKHSHWFTSIYWISHPLWQMPHAGVRCD